MKEGEEREREREGRERLVMRFLKIGEGVKPVMGVHSLYNLILEARVRGRRFICILSLLNKAVL